MNPPSATRSRRATGRATLADVARVAEVSVMTASRALRGERSVDALLAQRVHAAAEQLGYMPDPAARALASQRSSYVAVLIPSLTNALFVDLLEAAQRSLRSAGFQTLVGVTHYDAAEEELLVREHLLHRPAGMLLTGLEHARATRQWLDSLGTPCVTMMELDNDPRAASVGFSQRDAAAAMTRHLLKDGRQRIAFAAAQLDPRTLQRLQGWRDALSAAGCYDDSLEWLQPEPSSLAMGGQMLERILASQPAPDAIFFCNDDLAQGALLAALRLGVKVPRQLAVVGFNDLPASALMVPPLTTVRTPRVEIGQRAAELLLTLMRGEEPASRHQDLGFELVVRGSG